MTTRPARSKSALFAALATLTAALALSVGTLLPADQVDAQRRLRAQIHVTQAAVPRGLGERALLGFARGHRARTLAESTDAEIESRRWLANMVISFSSPPNDTEFHALFYDITDGTRDFVDDMAIYISDRTQSTYVQRMTLARPRFRPNRRLEMVVTVRRAEVGTVRFDLRGEEVRRSGMVDFTGGDED